VRLILADGETAGVVTLSEALRIAEQSGLDLVEISPNAEPPVCKVLDLGKFKYEQQKRKAEAKKKQKIVELKEIKVSPNIDTHDYDVKLKNATRFLEDGNKVKFSLKFKGREIAYQQMGYELMQKIGADLELLAKVEQPAKLEGKQMMMILGPK
jgi:translation initiation factor IF-3